MVFFRSPFPLVSCAISLVAGATYVFKDDCAKYPGPCKNDCSAIFTARVSDVMRALRTCPRSILADIQRTNRKQGASNTNRKAGGCVPNPCSRDIKNPSSRETSCDGHPFAGTSQGRQGSLLRFTTPRQNTSEGGALECFFQKYCGTKNCKMIIRFQNAQSA